MKLTWEYTETFNFSFKDEQGDKLLFAEWNSLQNTFISELSILNELLANGRAIETNLSLNVETEDILALDDFEKKILGLPENYPFSIYIESEGQLKDNDFKFKIGYFDFIPNGNQFYFTRIVSILKNNDFEYILNEAQFKLVESIKIFNQLPATERNFDNNLVNFADIKNLSSDAASILDNYLQDTIVQKANKIVIDISFTNETLELKPSIENVDNNDFQKSFNLYSTVKKVYKTKNIVGEKIRLVNKEPQFKTLEKIKKYTRVEDEATQADIVENPELYFDENVIDLSKFSERVREIGLYKPKYYPFICPYKSEWIPGFVVKDKVNGEKKIRFKTKVELAEFKDKRDDAIKNGGSNFIYKDEEIAVDAAEKIIDTAEKQFNNPKEPFIKHTKKNEKGEVLIIKENADLLEYTEQNKSPVKIEHKLYQVDNLKRNISLKTHQEEGIAWLQALHKKQLSGCLLADDMGLGKTLQILYFIEWHCQNFENDKPYLIVAPITLLENWENEYDKFFKPKNLKLEVLNNTLKVNKENNKSDIKKLQQKQILLTNYETIRTYQLNICAVDFALVALDEAQKIKTPGTLITNACKALKADFKIAMTGTPVENTFVDLWCIMDFCVPGLLGNAKDFAKQYQNPLKEDETDIVQLGLQLRQNIGSFIKRRLKTDVAKDLPKKEIKSTLKEMPLLQTERYLYEIEVAQNEDLSGTNKRNQILKSLWAIKEISDHPFLIDNQIEQYTSQKLIETSAKLQLLIEFLDEIKQKEDKAIVFTDRKATQKMIQKVICDKYYLFCDIINGDTPSTKKKRKNSKLSRQQTINKFEKINGFNIIIMSPIAAGVGLNVVGANHVIHYSRHWNPAKEQQATDRAYRIGQTKDVMVYYPMAILPKLDGSKKVKSFDEILDELLRRKSSLASSSLYPSEQIEVNIENIFDDTFSTISKQTYELKPLTITDADKLNPDLFEALIAAIYFKRAFKKVVLSPKSGDKGADVVVIGDGDSFLIQAKQTSKIVGKEAVQEIVAAKKFYDSKYKNDFNLVVITNNKVSTGETVKALVISNKVELIERKKLKEWLNDCTISFKDVDLQERKRLEKI